MIEGVAIPDFWLGVVAGILVSELVAIAWLSAMAYRDVKSIEGTLEQIDCVDTEDCR